MSFKVGNWQNQKNKGSHIVTSNQKFRDFKLYISLKGMKIDYGPESVSIVQGQGETMPETDMLPVLIYIGKRTGA